MLKIEKKFVEFLDRHMLLLAAALVTGLAFWIRRQCIWFYTDDYGAYFDAHADNIQSSLYYTVLHWLGYLPIPPIQSVKWLAIAADFAVAALCVLLFGVDIAKGKSGKERCGKEWSGKSARPVGNVVTAGPYSAQKERNQNSSHTAALILYTACLFSPVVFLRGAVWAQTDSVAMVFLLAAWWLDRKRHGCAALALAVLGTAWYPCFVLLVLGYLFVKKKEGGREQLLGLLLLCVLTGGLLAVCGLLNGGGAVDGFYSALRWTTFDPVTGLRYGDAAQWLQGMAVCLGYGLGLLSGIAAYRKKISALTALAANVTVAILYGAMLF